MTDAGEYDRRGAELTVWARQAHARSAACKAQAARAASSAAKLREETARLMRGLIERHPQRTEQLLAISATADGRRAVIAARKRAHAAGRAGGPSLIQRQEPDAAIIAELEVYLREMAGVQERDRISAELQDRVIQRVFTVGLSLQSAAGLTIQPEVRSRIEAATDRLDDVIRIIRDGIFGTVYRHPDRERGDGPEAAAPRQAD